METHIRPRIHLSCISYYLIQDSKTNHGRIRGQKHRHGSKVLTLNIIQTSNHNIQASNKHIHHKMHVHVNAKLTSLTLLHFNTYASMDDHVNACSWH